MTQNLFILYGELTLFCLLILPFISKSTLKEYMWVLLTVLPIVFYFYTIFSSTNNVPFKDDYSMLESIYKIKFSYSIPEIFKSLFSQVNQHRFFFERGVMLLIIGVLGNEDIKVQIVVGNVFLLGTLFLLHRMFKNLNLSFSFFIPVPLLLFNLTFFENSIWGIAAIQNTPIIFFALLTIYLLNLRTKKYFIISILFALTTLFTSGNGIAIWFVGILMLIIQKNPKKIAVWSLTMILAFSFYFYYDYQIIIVDKSNLIKYPFLNLLYILVFWGNVFFQNINHQNLGYHYIDIVMCCLTGLFLGIIIMILLFDIYSKRFKNIAFNSLTLLGSMLFMAFTGLMFVLSRPTEVDVFFGGEILSRRYMIFGAVFLAIGYLGFLHLTSNAKTLQKLGFYVIIPISLFINFGSYYTSTTDIYKQEQELSLDGYYWKNHQMLMSFGEKYGEKIGYNHPFYMVNLISNLDSTGIYKLSQHESIKVANLIKRSDSKIAKLYEGKIDTVISTGMTIARENKERIKFNGTMNIKNRNIKYLAIKSFNNIFLLPAIPETNSFSKCLTTQSLMSSHFSYETWRAKFPPDLYEIWVVEQDSHNNYSTLFCRKSIRI